jgi:glutathione-regulated potassium-efflux system protein KefB
VAHDGFLQYALILLLAAVIAVPLAKRWRLGAVIGYLGAGVLVGPSGLGLIGNSELIEQISELGIVLMLFVIGLELSPQRLWTLRRHVFGIGSLQVVATAALVGAACLLLPGSGWKLALVVGLGLALSSTAIDLQLLAERKELSSTHGRLAFAILLFQDVAAIPILAMIPILGSGFIGVDVHRDVLAVLRVVATIALFVVGGRYLLRPLFRGAAKAGSPEVFTAATLLVVIGTAWLGSLSGISMSLGAFLAGVLLADSEYRHEIEAQIEPFRGLLLGLFFIGIGMSLDLGRVFAQPQLVGALLLSLVAIKAIVLYLVARFAAREGRKPSLAIAALMAQGGEFSFVVFGLAAHHQLMAPAQYALATVVVTLSMVATPLLVGLRHEIAPIAKAPPQPREFDRFGEAPPRVIIAGMGRVGQIVARMLNANRIPFTALDNDPQQVDFMRQFGNTVFYGDASRLELLRAAHADKAEVFVIATEDPDSTLRTARLLKRHFPHLVVFARARNRQHVFRLMDLGIERVVRDTFFSSLEIARGVFMGLGYQPAAADDYVRRFREHDERVLSDQYPVYDDEAALLQSAREAREDLERLFQSDLRDDGKADARS